MISDHSTQWVETLPGLQYTRSGGGIFCLDHLEGCVQEMVGLLLNCEFEVMMVVFEAGAQVLSGSLSTFLGKQSSTLRS